jgi:hypothetical protein
MLFQLQFCAYLCKEGCRIQIRFGKKKTENHIFVEYLFCCLFHETEKRLGSIGNPYVSKDVTGICKFCNVAKTRGFSKLLQTKATVSPDFGVYFRLYKIKSVLSDGQILFSILNFVVPWLFTY